MRDALVNRRSFIKAVAATSAGTLGLASACAAQPAAAPETPTEHNAPAAPVVQVGTPTADEMDKLHETVVTAFVNGVAENSKTFWPARMPFKLDGDTKVFEITCQEVQWETAPGKTIDALTYNGIVPGPEIRVTEGDKVRVVVKNELTESTAIHLHGVYRAQQHGRRAAHHPAADQARRDLHLRVRGAQPRLAHVPLAPQRGRAGDQGSAGRLHHRAEGQEPATRPTTASTR